MVRWFWVECQVGAFEHLGHFVKTNARGFSRMVHQAATGHRVISYREIDRLRIEV